LHAACAAAILLVVVLCSFDKRLTAPRALNCDFLNRPSPGSPSGHRNAASVATKSLFFLGRLKVSATLAAGFAAQSAGLAPWFATELIAAKLTLALLAGSPNGADA